MRKDDYAHITWDLEDAISLLETVAASGPIYPGSLDAGLTRNRGELEEALHDDLTAVDGRVNQLLDKAHATEAADWDECREKLVGEFRAVLEPLLEGYELLHDSISDQIDGLSLIDGGDAAGDVQEALGRLRELQGTLDWAQRRTSSDAGR